MAHPLTGSQIRQTFLDFYAARGHQVLPSASLVPEDPTVLLTIAGMLPFKPVFLGQQPAPFPRATTSQKCIRTNDIENVGRTARHHTFFEMLGNFSFGDYFKVQAITWAWELVTEVFKLPVSHLVVSVYQEDQEAYEVWRDQIGVPPQRILRLGEADNFWVSGVTGPCGPCSEIYYDFYPEAGDQGINLEDDHRFIEFYNLVFMQYNRDAQGQLTPLAKQNIDTGMGLERMAQILQHKPNNYETDLIFPIIQAAAQIAGLDYNQASPQDQVSLKVIGDHLRAVVHLLADGVSVSNVGRGYVLRRLLRRVVRHGCLLGIDTVFTGKLATTVIELARETYPLVGERAELIRVECEREEVSFRHTLERGEKALGELLRRGTTQISGAEAFTLYDTYGFPLELTQEIAAEQGVAVDVTGFEEAMEQQRQRGRHAHQTLDLTAPERPWGETVFRGYDHGTLPARIQGLLVQGHPLEMAKAEQLVQVILDQTPFYGESGGQVGDRGILVGPTGEIAIQDVQRQGGTFLHLGQVLTGSLRVGDQVQATIDLNWRRHTRVHHTTTHLLQAALKQIVDPQITQAGSLVAFDRLRFDFYCSRSLTPMEIIQVEELVNHWIDQGHPAQTEVLPLGEAKARGAVAMFGEKYGEQVRVVNLPGVSMELCGGTHVGNTLEIGLFKIIAETGIAAGIRRIEAVAGPAVREYLQPRDQVLRDLTDRLRAKPEEIPGRVESLQAELRSAQKYISFLQQELAAVKVDRLLTQAQGLGDLRVLVANLGDVEGEALKEAATRALAHLGAGAVVLGSAPAPDKVSLVAAFSPQVVARGLQAGKFIGEVAKDCGGGGGGRPHLAQAGGRDPSQLEAALLRAQNRLTQALS